MNKRRHLAPFFFPGNSNLLSSLLILLLKLYSFIKKLNSNIFKGIIKSTELFDVTLSNPPFHSSLAEAQEESITNSKM